MPRTKKNHISQNEDPRFHNTYQFLKHYRDATYSLKVVVHQLETQFQIDYGTSIDHFLDSIYAAGADLNGSDIEERAKSIERSNKMLKLLDSAVDLLRSNHKYGEGYLNEGRISLEFDVTEDGKIVELTAEDQSISNQVIRGDLELVKVTL